VKNLLIIEDDADARGMITFTFENNGYNVVQSDKALSVKEILEIKPHIVIIDYMVNGTAGNDLCLKLKASEQTGQIPIILYSATASIDKIRINSCADGFIAKPYELEDFIYLVHRIALS
jgi:DNA-binding response OmpR family regulator